MPAPPLRVARSPVLPAVAAAVLVVVMLVHADTPIAAVAGYAVYWAAFVTWPGLVLWRCLCNRAGRLVDDIAIGSAVGLAVELPVYMAATALGHPRAHVAFAAAVIVAGSAVPGFRRRWLVGSTGACTPASAWMTAGAVVAGVAVVAARGFGRHPLTEGYALAAYTDLPYQLALAAEARHHFPLTTPHVAGLPLHYQYFVHEHLAAASWTSGVDLPLVVFRLGVVPLVVVGVLLTAALAHRLVRRSWVGGVAALLVVAATSFVTASWNIVDLAYVSPTQTYATVLFAAVLVLLVDVVRGRASAAVWAPVIVLLMASTGSKGTVLPLLVGGLGLLLASRLVARRDRRPAAVACGLSAAIWLAGMVVVFGGERLGLAVQPLHLLHHTVLAPVVGTTPPGLLVTLASALLTWGAPLAGAALLVRRTSFDAGAVLVASITWGAAAAALLFGHVSSSEGYFVRTAAVTGAAVVAAALARGALHPWPTRHAVATAVLACLGIASTAETAVATPAHVVRALVTVREAPLRTFTATTLDELRAARWLRAHSGTDDLVATDRHCRRRLRGAQPTCDGRAFWLTGTAERRVLVEGWAYTTASRAYADEHGLRESHATPFPDRDRLRANDAAFRRPSATGLATLRSRYGVRWLFATRLDAADRRTLDRIADPRFTSGRVRVYEIR